MQPRSKKFPNINYLFSLDSCFVYNSDYIFDCRAYLNIMPDGFSNCKLMIFK